MTPEIVAAESMAADAPACWPSARREGWLGTCSTLQRMSQMAGKVRLALTPLLNHYWNVALQVSSRGLTTGTMPWRQGGFELEFNLVEHRLELRTSGGDTGSLPLAAASIAAFYRDFIGLLADYGIAVRIWPMPVEMPNPVRFDRDTAPAEYDPESALALAAVLRGTHRALESFRGGFVGKSSPAHFFWGSFDLALTRFSGRRAPERPGADAVTREAYSHEVASVGFWPGNRGGPVEAAAFYAYAAPAPTGYKAAHVAPAAAAYNAALGEFILDYEAVRAAPSPSAALLDFCQSTYNAAADLGHWDRAALERH